MTISYKHCRHAGVGRRRDHSKAVAGRSRASVMSLIATSSGLGLAVCSPASAQVAAPSAPQPTPAAAGVEDIVVTAQRRSERLQDVPIAIAAVSSAKLAQQGITTTAELQQAVPGLVFNNPVNAASPYIRGVGSNQIDPTSESPVATYVDDVYIAAPQANLFSLSNIRQIDVLSGPQGTLFGRNATGGVIQIQTLDPASTFKFNASATYGSYDFVSIPVYMSVPLSGSVASDLAVLYEDQGSGYGRDLTTGSKTYRQAIDNITARNKWLFKISPDTTARLSVDYSNTGNNVAYQKIKGAPSLDGHDWPGPFNTYNDFDDRTRTRTGGVSLKVDQNLGSVVLTSISAYRKFKGLYDLDDDTTSLPLVAITLHETFSNVSQELRLANSGQHRLKWVVGAFYYNARGGYDPLIINNAVVIPFDQQRTISYAGFAQSTLTLFKGTNLTGGIRFTNEQQQFKLPAASLKLNQEVNKVTYRVALDHHFSRDVMAYVSYNTGFKSGGYNLITPGNSFRPETLDALEIGAKAELLNRALRLNVDAFRYSYKNQQYLVNNSGLAAIHNAASTRTTGVEGTFDIVPIEAVSISGGVTYLDSHYRSFPNFGPLDASGTPLPPVDATGNRAAVTPKIIASLAVNARRSTAIGTFEGSVGAQYNSGYFWEADNRLRQPRYTVVNASLSWTPHDGKVSFKVWGKNITNATYYSDRLTGTSFGDTQTQSPPATGGVTVAFRY